MRRFLILILCGVLLSGIIPAQDKKGETKDLVPPVVKNWKLTPSQQKVLAAFIEEYNRKIQEMIFDFIKEIRTFKIYPDMPADAKFNLQSLAFEGVPVQEKKESGEVKK